jgi:hypothetical protein
MVLPDLRKVFVCIKEERGRNVSRPKEKKDSLQTCKTAGLSRRWRKQDKKCNRQPRRQQERDKKPALKRNVRCAAVF